MRLGVQMENPDLELDKYTFGIGVQCIVLSESKILMGRRKRIFGDGSWGLPGGRLERGETIMRAAHRELSEETGLFSMEMRVVALSDPGANNNFNLQICVLVESWSGNPRVLEPTICSELDFFPIENLPQPIFVGSKDLIEAYLKNCKNNYLELAGEH